jgi:myo-inositol 2-dehydrogenase/D-chiro-inositol 1-dehydrogenase
MSKVRFALCGYGAWGKLHAQSIAIHPEADLVAIAAPSQTTRAQARQDHPRAIVYDNALTMIGSADFDILDVVTPSHTHRDLAVAALERDTHVLLEKPLATSLTDCTAIVQASKASKGQLAVGHELRLSSQWSAIQRIIREGTLGHPQYVLVELSRKPYRLGADGWRYDAGRVGSWVLEEPIHFFDLARWYLSQSGDPVELTAYANSRDVGRPGLFDNFSAMFRYADGAYAVISQTLAAFEHHQTVKVSGTRGALWAQWSGAQDRTLEPSYFLKLFDGDRLQKVPIDKHSGEVFELREEIDMCVRMVRGQATPIADARDGFWSAGLCLVAEQSIRERRPVGLEELAMKVRG